MIDGSEAPPDLEALIQRKQEEFRKATENVKKLHPGVGFGIDPGSDPIAQEALVRLMEETLEGILTTQTGHEHGPEHIRRMKQELREQLGAIPSRRSEDPESM